jgi:hypothetical protein
MNLISIVQSFQKGNALREFHYFFSNLDFNLVNLGCKIYRASDGSVQNLLVDQLFNQAREFRMQIVSRVLLGQLGDRIF